MIPRFPFWHKAIRSKTNRERQDRSLQLSYQRKVNLIKTIIIYFQSSVLSRADETDLWHIGSCKSFHVINTCWYIYPINHILQSLLTGIQKAAPLQLISGIIYIYIFNTLDHKITSIPVTTCF